MLLWDTDEEKLEFLTTGNTKQDENSRVSLVKVVHVAHRTMMSSTSIGTCMFCKPHRAMSSVPGDDQFLTDTDGVTTLAR